MLFSLIRFEYYRCFHSDQIATNSYIRFISPFTKIILGKGKLYLGRNLVIEPKGYISTSAGGTLQIGDNVFINRNCYIGCRHSIKIGNNCILGPNVSIYDHNHKFSINQILKNEYSTGEVVIEDGCWICDGAKILKGAYIGKGAVIGAGVVVSGVIEPHSIVKPGFPILEKIYDKTL